VSSLRRCAEAQVVKLKEAINIINTTRRRSVDPPLVMLANCDECGEDFAMLPQDFSRADVHGHPKICRPCSVERRRKSRRVKP
jgi:hypothetical protein